MRRSVIMTEVYNGDLEMEMVGLCVEDVDLKMFRVDRDQVK